MKDGTRNRKCTLRNSAKQECQKRKSLGGWIFFAIIEPSWRRIAGTAFMAMQEVSTSESQMPFSSRWLPG